MLQQGLQLSEKWDSCQKQQLDNMTTLCGNEIFNTTYKTAIFCKREVKENVLSSVAIGQIHQQEITIKHRDSKDISVLRRRWFGFRVSDSTECNLPSVYLKYDEIMYPISRLSTGEETIKSIGISGTQNFQQPERVRYCRWMLLLICIILSAVVIGSYLLFQNTCIKILDTQKFGDILNENFFGQDEIKEQLIKTFEAMNSPVNSDLKFLMFSGSSGVGKTYVASLIAQFFPWSKNVQHLMVPVHSELSASDVHRHLSLCGCNLVIIDDLKKSDANMIFELITNIKLMDKEQSLKVIFIFIFNTEHSFIINDTDNFSICVEANRLIMDNSVTHFKFKKLMEADVIKCIEKLLYERGITKSQIFISEFFSNFMSPSFLESGCKRISSKLGIFLEMYEQKKLKANFQ